MKVLSVDPGGTTGFAYWESLWPDEEDSADREVFRAWDEPDYFEAIETVRQEILSGCDIVVCESFQISMNTLKKSTAGSLATIRMMGAIEWICHCRNVPFELQSPSDARTFDDKGDKLRLLGWWTKGSDHARSATKHLLLYLVKTKLVDPLRVIQSEEAGGAH